MIVPTAPWKSSLEILLEILLLDGDKLVSHGPNAVRVRDEARRQGMECPFVVRVPADFGTLSAGWLRRDSPEFDRTQ